MQRKGKICLNCGDKGWPNALVYCVNCLRYAVHRYCLKKLPASFDEFVHWVCDDCEVEMPKHIGSLDTEPIQLENGDYKDSEHGKPNLKERSSKRKKTRNVVLDTSDPFLQHQSPGYDFPTNMNDRKKIKKGSRELYSGSFTEKHKKFPKEKVCEAYAVNRLNDDVDSAELENRHSSPLKSGNKTKHEKKNVESATNFSSEVPIIEDVLSEYPSNPEMEHSRLPSGDVNAELEVSMTSNQIVDVSPLNKSNKKKRVVSTLSTDLQGQTATERQGFGSDHLLRDETVCNSSEVAQPLADPIWRGSFNILNRECDEYEGMVAHLSIKACQKAYQEARSFPTLLDLEMYPKFDVWPKSFERSEPTDDSIALYFFPTHKRYERMFDHLVEEMMNDELAMRAILENAELLIFTSRELPLNFWRFQGKYYLWGVFRAKQLPAISQKQSLFKNNHDVVVVKDDEKHREGKKLE